MSRRDVPEYPPRVIRADARDLARHAPIASACNMPVVSELPSAVEATVLALHAPGSTPRPGTEAQAGGGGEPTSAADADALSAGVVLASRWELLALLGVGGMGSVYRARDRELDELVAVKVLRRELASSPGMLERFRREVKLARRVTHPNVARTFDIGDAGELRFLTMELLDGAPLSRHTTRGRGWPLARIAPVVSGICAGLSAAHAAGVIHRDLKPDNVIVERSGRVVITDFGIARALGIQGRASETQGGVVGTPLYMAPEQVAEDDEIGPAADIYALGCMLFELASGAPPWAGPTPLSVAAARLLAPPPDLRSRQADVPDAFARLVTAMMDRQPARRPGTASEVAEALAAITPTPTARPRSSTISTSPASLSSLHGQAEASLASPTEWGAPKSLAVLPIANRGPDEDAYLASALADDLADLLTGSPGLRVRPRALAARAAHSSQDPREIGRELGVQVVVTGDLRRQGDMVHATVRLLTVEDGFQLWAGRFSAHARDFMRVGDETAAAIAAALIARPMPKREAPADPESLDLYMRGRYLLARTWGSTTEAVTVLSQALERSPTDRRIRVAFALASIRGFSLGDLPVERASAAAGIIDELLADDPRDQDALFARAQLHFTRGESTTAARDIRASIEAGSAHQPSLALLGDMLLDVGDIDRARAALERACHLDPTHYAPRMSRVRLAGLEGDFACSRALLAEAPSDPFDVAVYWVVRSRFALWSRNADEAREVRERFVASEPPGFLRDVCEATTAVVLGLPLSGDTLAKARSGLDPRASQRIAAFHMQFRAEVQATLGDVEGALAALAGADGHGTFDALWIERCPALAPLRGRRAFEEIRERILGRAERVGAALGTVRL